MAANTTITDTKTHCSLLHTTQMRKRATRSLTSRGIFNRLISCSYAQTKGNWIVSLPFKTCKSLSKFYFVCARIDISCDGDPSCTSSVCPWVGAVPALASALLMTPRHKAQLWFPILWLFFHHYLCLNSSL